MVCVDICVFEDLVNDSNACQLLALIHWFVVSTVTANSVLPSAEISNSFGGVKWGGNFT